jgi:hypothetical protein
MKVTQLKKIVDLWYVDSFDYKFAIITKVDLFKDYINIIHVDEASLRFAIHYSKSQRKRNELSIDISYYAKFNMWGLKLISIVFIHLRQKKKTG